VFAKMKGLSSFIPPFFCNFYLTSILEPPLELKGEHLFLSKIVKKIKTGYN
jgi:hypothetical protein